MKKKQTMIGDLYSPYSSGVKDNMFDWYEAYLLDSDKHLVIDGKTYSKIISKCEFYVYDSPTLLVSFGSTNELYIGDILMDEQGREFIIKAFEMIRFAGNIPQWYLKLSHVLIEGKDYSVGNYLCKKCCT